MSFNHRKTVTYRLVQASKAYRQRSASILAELDLHPGQDQILKALADEDGQTMGALAHALSVQPPTITKMVVRLSAQGMVERRPSANDGRSSTVFLTEKGQQLIGDLDARLKRMDQDALKGFEGKDRKRLRKALIQLERNLSGDIEEDAASTDSEPSAS
ncbi:MAG: MarR family winged helix-turn-helix transcriptional regulator [Hyphomicrobiales bacterium]